MNEKGVSRVLKTFGFLNRKRTNAGWVVLIDRAARKHIHELLSRYGVDSSESSFVTQDFNEPCEFCQAQDKRGPEPPFFEEVAKEVPAEPAPLRNVGASSREHSERSERGEHEKDAEKIQSSTKFIEDPDDEALIRALQVDDPGDLEDPEDAEDLL